MAVVLAIVFTTTRVDALKLARPSAAKPISITASRICALPSLTFNWDYRRFLLDKGLLELYTTGEYSYPYTDAADFALTAEAGMRIRLTQNLHSTISTELDALQSDQSARDDWKHFFGLGYSW